MKKKKETAKNANGDEVVNLKWVIIGNGMPENYDSWIGKVNDYIGEKIGVNLEMEVIPWGDWDDRRNIIISTNEPYDIIFGNGNNYTADIKLGAYVDITDMIPEIMKEFNELMPEKYWDAVKVDDRIYGVPAYKDSSISNYAVWDKELVDEYNIDYKNLTTVESLTPTFEMLKKEKNDYPVYVKNDGVYSIFDVYDQLGAGTQILGVRYDDEKGKVCFTLEEPDIYAALETFHDWSKKGIINPDAATLTEARVYNMWRIAQGWESAGETAWGPDMGKEVVVQKWGDTILSNETVRGSMNMISANSKYPEKCLELLNLVNTDTTLRDMFYYGEEGVNFEYVDVDGQKKVHKINTDWSMAGYTQGTFFTVTPEDTVTTDQWGEIKALNEAAVPSVMLGFNFDTTEVDSQLANCREVWLRYKSEVMAGVNDPAEVVPQIKKELMAAGFQDVMDAAQAQVDEFLASK
ncbi:ABC transporter substrate-binding protein [Blautia argi]|uniref:ABC transporter substrate-binding protein n=1 Tax=Blautia argi TaxID=1912897 RepID=UPI001FA87B0D|nr:ABC transporter substrate-binding protein [Blautia argi]